MDVHLPPFLAVAQFFTTDLSSLSFWFFALLLLFLYAFLSACERSFLSLSREALTESAAAGSRQATQLLECLDKPQKFLRRLRAMELLLSLALGLLVFFNLTAFFIQEGLSWVLLYLSLCLLMTWVILALASQLPRLALAESESFPRQAWPFLRLLEFLTAPFILPGLAVADTLLRLLKFEPEESPKQLTEEELRAYIDEGRLDDKMDHEEQHLLENLFEFRDKNVSECMTHRMDLVAIPDDIEQEELLALIAEEKFTRLPVYHEDIDHIVGVLHSRDFLLALARDKQIQLEKMMREPYFAPETIPVATLFRAMQKQRNHMAVIIDEYGGTAGIATVEDLLEEIVGQIQDEYDEELPELEKLNDHLYLAEGQLSLRELAEAIDRPLPEEDFDTVAGLVLDILDRIPEEHEQPEVLYEDIRFQVVKMDDKRIELVRVTLPEGPGAEGAEA